MNFWPNLAKQQSAANTLRINMIKPTNRSAKKAHMRESAKKYEWLRKNCASFSWLPSRYNSDKVTGFAAFGTGYSGFEFDEAVKMAMKK